MTRHTLKLVPLLLSGTILTGAIIDRLVNTGSFVCAIDPTCRQMTPGEIALAKPIFGDTIPYDQVHIFNRPAAYNLLYPNTIAAVHRSNMFLPETMGPARYDFGPGDEHADDFIHELPHLWQHYAEGINNAKGRQEYGYDLGSRQNFRDFNQEQQAEIVREYFNRHSALTDFLAHAARRPGQDTAFRNAKIAEYCADLAPYEAKLVQALPIKPVPSCPKP